MSIVTTLPSAAGHFISLSEAAAMTLSFRTNKETILATAYQHAGLLPSSETFNRAAIDALLAVPGCEGLRIYYGMDEHLKLHAILAPVDENNADIFPSANGSPARSDEDIIVEKSQRCPDDCPPPSPLNN